MWEWDRILLHVCIWNGTCGMRMGFVVTGYDSMGYELSKPHLRAELEADLKRCGLSCYGYTIHCTYVSYAGYVREARGKKVSWPATGHTHHKSHDSSTLQMCWRTPYANTKKCS